MIKLKIVMFAVFMICTQSMLSQTKTVSGEVSDSSGLPMPGINILVAGTTNGTQSDFDGKYTLDNVSSTDNLVFSFIGMKSQTVSVGTQSSINVKMEESTESLDEVVIVAYGSQSRAKVTGAVSVVDSEEIAALPVPNAEQALQGRAAGVNIVNSGSPGSSPQVLIRGLSTINNNNPLYVIDGVITGNLTGISPSDIESISILKDAATASLYGARAANGVVLVTTKTGKSGKGKLTFNTYTGVQYNTERYDVLNTIEYLKFAGEIGIVPNRPAEIFLNDVNYQDEIFTTGFIQDYNVGYSGGTETSKYLFSAEYLKQEGVIIETGFERYSFRANTSSEFGKLTVGQTLSVAFSKNNPEQSVDGRSLLTNAIKAAPYLPVYNPANLGGFQGPNTAADGQDAQNPVRSQLLGKPVGKNFGLIGNVFAEYKITEELKFRTSVGIDYFFGRGSNFVPSYNDDNLGQTHSENFAQISRNSGTGQAIIYNNSLSYTKTFADMHNLTVLVLSEKTINKGEGLGGSSRNAVTNEINQLSNEDSTLGSGSNETVRIGYLSRLNYDYDGKYIIEGSIRRDASSRFGENRRWGTFWGATAGWNIAKESFMEDTAFSTLKLRGSYGIVGNDKIGDYQFSPALVPGFQYPINGQSGFGVTANGSSNPNLQWEELNMENYGLDFGLFNEKITGAFEYYNTTSDGLLINVPTTVSNGNNQNTVTRNIGSISTSGYEASLGFNDSEGEFTWGINANISTTKTKVLDLGVDEILQGGAQQNGGFIRLAKDEAAYDIYGLEMIGIYQNQAEVDAAFFGDPGQTAVQPGDVKYRDINSDGVINSDDRKIIGNINPDLNIGLNFNAEYKNFDMNLFFYGVAGNQIYNTMIFELEGDNARLFNTGTQILDRWSPTNPSNTIPRFNGASSNISPSSRYVEDGDYARLKNVTLGYTIPKGMVKNLFTKFRIYVSAQNLVTFTNYSGLDPEIVGGIDYGRYPQPKSALIGLQIAF